MPSWDQIIRAGRGAATKQVIRGYLEAAWKGHSFEDVLMAAMDDQGLDALSKDLKTLIANGLSNYDTWLVCSTLTFSEVAGWLAAADRPLWDRVQGNPVTQPWLAHRWQEIKAMISEAGKQHKAQVRQA